MTRHVIPEDAVHTIKRRLHGVIWFKGASLVGIGPDAAIEVHTASLQEASYFLGRIDGRWEGYKVRIRRASQ